MLFTVLLLLHMQALMGRGLQNQVLSGGKREIWDLGKEEGRGEEREKGEKEEGRREEGGRREGGREEGEEGGREGASTGVLLHLCINSCYIYKQGQETDNNEAPLGQRWQKDNGRTFPISHQYI